MSHWFGYRPPPKETSQPPPPATSVPLVWFFSFIGAFIGIAIIENVFESLPRLDGAPAPIVIASFGAAAILEYNTIESPLSQPRNLIFGHALSATIGVAITKLFLLLPEARFMELRWLAGALSVGTASAVMGITKTVHPPAGATALLAATSPEVLAIGWWLIVLVLLAGVLMLTSAMIVNNLYKRFPLYWWTPVNLKQLNESKIQRVRDVERGDDKSDSDMQSDSDAGLKKHEQFPAARNGSDVAEVEHQEVGTDLTDAQRRNIHNHAEQRLLIAVESIVVPDWMQLSQWEAEVLESFQRKLREQDRSSMQ